MRLLIADPGLREKMGEAAREDADRFTAKRLMPGWERLIRDVLNDSSPDDTRSHITGSGTPRNSPAVPLAG
jgi:hypothetical protein